MVFIPQTGAQKKKKKKKEKKSIVCNYYYQSIIGFKALWLELHKQVLCKIYRNVHEPINQQN